MIKFLKPAFLLTLSSLFIFSCTDNKSSKHNFEVPTTYEFLREGISTVDLSDPRIRIGMATELVNAMTDFNLNSSTLLEMYANQTVFGEDVNPFENPEYNVSKKSIKSKVAESIDLFENMTLTSTKIKSQIELWIVNQVDEVYPNINQLAEVGQAGQIADGSTPRYVNEKGLEYNQAVNKSLIGALIVDQLCNNYLSKSILDEGTNVEDNNNALLVEGQSYTQMENIWDKAYGYLFGFSQNPRDPLLSLGDDLFLNKYLSRVEEDEDFKGIAESIFEAFKLGRAAITAGKYDIRDQQIVIIKEKIAEIIAIRSVYYLQNGKASLLNNNYGSAFHDLSEGLGFIYSLRFLTESNNSNPIFTMQEVDEFMDQLSANNGFWDIDTATLDQISTSIAKKFEFTVSEAAN